MIIYTETKAAKKARKKAERAKRKARLAANPKPPEQTKKPKSFNSFYSTETWKKLRYDALLASKGRCEACGTSARFGAELRVDHIKPIRLYPHLKADPDNLQVLCNSCNWGKGSRDETDWRYGAQFEAGRK